MSSAKTTAIVTGGTSAIGLAIVEQLCATGKDVVFSYRSNELAARELMTRMEGRAQGFAMDLLDTASIERFVSDCQRHLSRKSQTVGTLIHNAGFCSDGPFFLMAEQDWRQVIDTSLNSFYYLNKAFLADMIAARFGRIITMVSVSGEAGNRGQVNYSAAKGALIAATKALAKEVSRKGVLVNAVSPGIIASPMTDNLAIPDLKNLVPVGRKGTPAEVAHAVLFLASEQASYITGTVLQVNGGLYT